MAKKKTEQDAGVTRFSVADLCASEAFRAHRDALSVALNRNKEYSVEEARASLDKFMKRKVN